MSTREPIWTDYLALSLLFYVLEFVAVGPVWLKAIGLINVLGFFLMAVVEYFRRR